MEQNAKENVPHKDVERKRRMAIAKGLSNLEDLMPCCKGLNKNNIVLGAVSYIERLQADNLSNIEKRNIHNLNVEKALDDLAKAVVLLENEDNLFTTTLQSLSSSKHLLGSSPMDLYRRF